MTDREKNIYQVNTWLKIVEHFEPGRWYTVSKSRPDYDQFVEAVKEFRKICFNFAYYEKAEHIEVCLYDMKFMLQDMKVQIEKPVFVEEVQVINTKRDSFYTDSYSEKEISEQRKQWGAEQEPNIPSEANSSPQETLKHPDHTNTHPEKDNASERLELSETKNKSNEQTTETIEEETEW